MTSKKKLKRKIKKLEKQLEAEREHSELTTQNWQQCDKLFASIISLIVDELGDDWLQCTIDEINEPKSGAITWNIDAPHYYVGDDGKITVTLK